MITPIIGNYGLALAILVSCFCVLAAISSRRFQSDRWLVMARRLIYASAGLLTLTCVVLMAAILTDDFRLSYVTQYSEKALAWEFKLAAFWAGHSGSLLLWAWMMAVMASIAAATRRKDPAASQAPAMGIMAVVVAFFCMLILLADDPFLVGQIVPPDGGGLNPQLQDWAMIAHPPLLFLGYSACLIPFAYGLGAIIAGRRDGQWIPSVRRWVLVAWLFLTSGIVLGAEWAYVELGWGGYWAWDPVENASLLPWFTATALIHSLIVQQRKGMLKVWNAFLLALTFILCIFGTYLTRSGVIASVHAFPKSTVGWFFLTMLGLLAAGSVGVILVRLQTLASDRKLLKLLSFEGGVLGANLLLTVMMFTTLIGTIFPLLSGPFTPEAVTLEKGFYNTAILPMGIGLLILMGMGPALRFAAAPGALRRRLFVPVIVMHVAIVAVAWISGRNVWATFAGATATLIVASVLDDIVRTARNAKAGYRRWVGYAAHLGMAMILLGIAGTGLYSETEDFDLKRGDAVTMGAYKLKLDDVRKLDTATYFANEAVATLTEPDGAKSVLRPQLRRYYKSSNMINSEVSIRPGLLEDVYLILRSAKTGEDAGAASLGVYINPLVIWIWIGGAVLTLSGIVCVLLPAGRAHTDIELEQSQ